MFGVNLGCGIIAGFAAAILSQPADTLLSQVSTELWLCKTNMIVMIFWQINKGHGPKGSMTSRLIALAREAGFRGLFAGLGPRMIMTAGLVAGQFLIYDEVKHGLFYFIVSSHLNLLIV